MNKKKNIIFILLFLLFLLLLIYYSITGYYNNEKVVELFNSDKDYFVITKKSKTIKVYFNDRILLNFKDYFKQSEFYIDLAINYLSNYNKKIKILIITDFFLNYLDRLSYYKERLGKVSIVCNPVSIYAQKNSKYLKKIFNSNHKFKNIDYFENVDLINGRFDIIILDKFTYKKKVIDNYYNKEYILNIKKYFSADTVFLMNFAAPFFNKKVFYNYKLFLEKYFKKVFPFKLNLSYIIQDGGFLLTDMSNFTLNRYCKFDYSNKGLKYINSKECLLSNFFLAKDEKSDIIIKDFMNNLSYNVLLELKEKVK